MKTDMNDKRKIGEKAGIILTNILLLFAFAVAELLGAFFAGDAKLVCQVISRGILGVTILFNGVQLTFTKHWSFLVQNASRNKRLVIGILLLLVGTFGLVTAILGYGTNGEPRLLWWK